MRSYTLHAARLLTCTVFLAAVLPLSAATINLFSAGLFNTGVNGAGAPLSGGAQDPHWNSLQTGTGAFQAQSNNQAGLPSTNWPMPSTQLTTPGTGPWVASATSSGTPVSQWISFQSNVNTEPAMFYEEDYFANFSLTGFDPTTVEIIGVFAVDDSLAGVMVNGHTVTSGISLPGGFGSKATFDITNASCSGGCFTTGSNFIIFRTLNSAGSLAPDPSGLLVEYTSATANVLTEGVPEPHTGFVVGLGLFLIALIYGAVGVNRRIFSA